MGLPTGKGSVQPLVSCVPRVVHMPMKRVLMGMKVAKPRRERAKYLRKLSSHSEMKPLVFSLITNFVLLN